MMNNFTFKKPIFFHVPKLMALVLFFCLQALFVLTIRAQTSNPVVTNSATYDVFMNIDPSRGINPTDFSNDVSTYLTRLGAASGSYRINTSAVTLDPTDVTKWDVYDHYDTQWYANKTAWSASPGGFNNGNIPSNWYYYGVSDSYGGSNSKITIAQLLAGNGTWGQTGRLQSHIYPYVENGKPAMQFYGYSAIGAVDFLYYPADVASTKTVKFDIDASNVITHTLQKAGFLINCGTTGTGSSKTISGYVLLFTWSPEGSTTPPTGLASVEIYQLTNVNVDQLHDSGTGAPGTLIKTSSFNTFYTKSHIELSLTSTSLTATIQQLDGSGNLTGSKSTMFNSQALTNTGFGGFGPFVMYASHGCTSASAFRYSNLEMAFGGVLSGNSALESYQYANYLDNSTNRFFVNLTNTSATNYAGSSNDMDNAYLTRMKDDKAILITDESTGTYLPGTLNENIKNVTSEPSDATVASALGLSDLSGLTAQQQLAAKTAYLILHTTLGAYGTIPIPSNTAVASLYLMDGPGTDASWTGANQVNQIRSWLVSGSNINIYLDPDNSVNVSGLAATYTLTDPNGTKTTISTLTDSNNKLYFAFPKSSIVGEYSVTLNYATGGGITSTVPSTATFNYLPVPPLDGTPSISGTMQYGQLLTVTPNVTNNTGILSYQWKANGVNISGATGSTYILTANEVGKTITCEITSNVQTGTLSATASGTVAKVTLTPTLSAVNSKTYNGTTATTGGTISFSGTVNSENPTYSATFVWTSPTVGTGTVNVSSISLTSMSDRYMLATTSLSNVTPGNGSTINTKATPTVSVYPTASAITYGQTLGSSTLTTGSAVVNGVSGSITGSYVWTNSLVQPTSAGTFSTASVTFTPTDVTNYSAIDFTISLTVNAKPITITADSKNKIYGDSDPELSYQITSGNLVGSDAFTGTLSRNIGEDVGSYQIQQGTVALNSNYSLSYIPANLSITAATLTVTAEAKTKIYGDNNPVLTFNYSGWKNSETETVLNAKPVASTTVTNTTSVGTCTNVITVSGGSDDNYTFSYVPANFTITAATLTVTADSKTKVYGDDNPILTFTYSGWKNNETETVLDTKPTASTSVNQLSNVGTYTSVITVLGGSDNNYVFSYVPANFTITAATLTVTADSKTRKYGDSNPVLTFQYSGWKNSETETVLDTKPTASTSVNQLSNVGTYTNVITVLGGLDNNYVFSYVPADLIVTKATLLVTADNQTKAYGQINPSLTFKYSGWKNSETEIVLDSKPIGTTTVTLTTSPGIYENAITLSGGADNNYDFAYISADFEVTKGVLIVWLDPKTKEYGQDNPVLTYRYTGFMNGDDESDLDILHNPSTTVNKYTEPGVYLSSITMVGGLDDHYQIFDVPANFTVTKARPQILFDELTSKTYGDQDFTVSASSTISGIPVTLTSSNENVAVVSGNKVTIKGIGTATITAAQLGNERVESVSKSNVLSVNPKLLTVDGLFVKEKEYDATAVAQFVGGTLSGVVYSDVIVLNIPATGTFSQTTVGNNIPVSATITVSGDKAGNYTFQAPEMKGNILPKVITVTAKEVTLACNQIAEDLKYTYEPSLINDDKFTGVLTRTIGDAPGVYPISIGSLTAGSNYSIKFKPANYTILSQANQPPVVDNVGDQKVSKNSKQLVITLTGIDPVSGCSAQDIESIVASAENKTLIPEIQVGYIKGQATATLKLTIADNQLGETKITVKLKDNGGTDNGGNDTKEISFKLKVEIPTGVSDISEGMDVKVYPNPSSGSVKIDCIGFTEPFIRIFNLSGEEVLKKSILGGLSQVLNLSDFISGVYFVEISENSKIVTKKLIIKK